MKVTNIEDKGKVTIVTVEDGTKLKEWSNKKFSLQIGGDYDIEWDTKESQYGPEHWIKSVKQLSAPKASREISIEAQVCLKEVCQLERQMLMAGTPMSEDQVRDKFHFYMSLLAEA